MAVPSATVIQYYTGVLRLQPTAAQVTLYSNAADAATLLNILETEALTQINPIIRLYQGAFNRVPDSGGLTFIAGQYANGPVGTTGAWSLTQISQNFCSSPEFTATYGSSTPVATTTGATAYISALYNNILGRVPATSEVAYWQAWTAQQLAAGSSAATVTAKLLTMFTESPEFIQSSAPYIQNFQAASAQGTETYTGTLWAQGIGETFTLTTGVDAPGFGAFAAGSPTGNSTTMAIIGTGATLNAYDQIQATGGNNNMTLVDVTGGQALPSALVSGVQTLNVRSAAGVGNTNTASFDVSGWTGLTAVNVTQSAGADFLKAAATTAVNVNNTGAVTVAGGSTQTVTTSAGDVTLSGAAGAVNLTDTAQGAYDILVKDGTNVNVTTTQATSGSGNTITIGSATAADQPTGVITIVANEGPAASGNFTGGTITTYGGTAVNVTVNGTQPAAANGSAPLKTTQSNVSINGGTATTTATVNQTAATAGAQGAAAVTGVKYVYNVPFSALNAGDFVTVGGLTFTALANQTAAQVAAAFANLANGAISGSVNAAAGFFSGALSGWVSGAAASGGSAVTFTASATGTTTLSATGVTPVATTTGVAAVTGVTAAGAIANGSVTVTDINNGSTSLAGTITTVNVGNGFNGVTVNDNALSTLSLTANATAARAAGSGGAVNGAVVINNGSLVGNTATTLNATLNMVDISKLADAGVYKTVNLTLTGANSFIGADGGNTPGNTLYTTAATALNVSGTGVLTLGNNTVGTAAGLTSLKTVTVSGAAGLSADLRNVTTLTDVNASATSGNNSIAIDATKSTYEGGSGNDTLTVLEVSKVVTLGSGNDRLVIGNQGGSITGTVTADIIGGLGTDTVAMTTVDASAYAASSQFISHLNGFETVQLYNGGGQTVDLGLLALATGCSTINGSVIVDGGSGVTLANFANNGTLTIDGAQSGTIALTNAAAWTGAGTANIVLDASPTAGIANAVTGGIVSLAGASTANISTTQSTQTSAGVAIAAVNDTLTVTDVGTTDALTTINVTGNSNLTLTGSTQNTVLTAVNATGMTGKLTYVAAGTLAQTVTGGNGNDALSAHASSTIADTLVGGTGNDTLTTNAGLTTLIGGAGSDTFVVNVANTSATIYSTIADFGVGDSLTMKALQYASFVTSKVSLAPTATFAQYLDAAAAAGSLVGSVAWFQFGGNTYVLQNVDGNATYDAGTDIVVGLTGTVDMSHAGVSLLSSGSTLTPTLTLFA